MPEAHAFIEAMRLELGLQHQPVELLQLFVLGVARWAPVFSLAPFLGGKLVPAIIRLALSVSMGLWLLPGFSARAPQPLVISELNWWALLIKEVLIGFTLAFAAALIFWAAEMGGRFIDNVRGTTTANLLLPQVQVQSSLLGGFYFQLFVVLFVFTGGHLWFMSVVFESYRFFPVLELTFDAGAISEGLALATGSLFSMMIRIIAPALIAIMLLDLMLGVANRMAPQLDVFFISLSVKATLGALLVALSLNYLLMIFDGMLLEHQSWLAETMGIYPTSYADEAAAGVP